MKRLADFRKGLFPAALLTFAALAAGAADLPTPAGTKQNCCGQESAEVARWLKNSDRLYSQFKPREALVELRKVLQVDANHFEALVKTARAYIDIGDQIAERGADWKERKLTEYATAEEYARRAVRVNANSTWGYLWVAAAVGNIAMVSPLPKQLDLADEIRAAVEKAIALDTKNGSAYHIYGVWHRKLAEIGAMSRMFANLMYGRSVPTGSMEKSIEYLQRAVALNPTVIISRLELARSYIAVEAWPQAQTMLKSIPELLIQFSDDAKHKERAAELLAEIEDR